MAIADEERGKAGELVRLTRAPMTKIMQLFAPDGGFEEGPTYWNYATAYNVCYLAALESALDTDFGLSQAAGFADTGNYRMQTIGPLGKDANFGDAGEEISSAPQMLWLAVKFHHPEYASHEQWIAGLPAANPKRERTSRFGILELLWRPPGGGLLADARRPAGAKFDRVATAFFRGAWGDTNAVYVAFKGGSNQASHGHLDLGSFVLDAFGERWAMDLGADSYGLPGYFGAQRWSYYRLRTEGHNTLTVNEQNEALKAEAPLTSFFTSPNRSYAIADLQTAYPQALTGWKRGLALWNRHQVLLQDEVQPQTAADLTWNFHTRAAIAIAGDGREATLTQGASKLLARVLSPDNARFEDLAVQVRPPEHPTTGIRNLVIHLPHAATPATIAVWFSAPEDRTPAPALAPLAAWRP